MAAAGGPPPPIPPPAAHPAAGGAGASHPALRDRPCSGRRRPGRRKRRRGMAFVGIGGGRSFSADSRQGADFRPSQLTQTRCNCQSTNVLRAVNTLLSRPGAYGYTTEKCIGGIPIYNPLRRRHLARPLSGLFRGSGGGRMENAGSGRNVPGAGVRSPPRTAHASAAAVCDQGCAADSTDRSLAAKSSASNGFWMNGAPTTSSSRRIISSSV